MKQPWRYANKLGIKTWTMGEYTIRQSIGGFAVAKYGIHVGIKKTLEEAKREPDRQDRMLAVLFSRR